MCVENIGNIIYQLRKKKGITQEELGNQVGVSMQAVSKWECGGVPDTKFIPKIAEFFRVSIDVLFGKEKSYLDLKKIIEKISRQIKDNNEKVEQMFFYNWAMHLGIIRDSAILDTKELYNKARIHKHGVSYSRHLSDEGITFFDLSKEAPYLYVFPESKERTSVLLSDTDYCSLFSDLADEDFFNCLVYLYKRDFHVRFTPELLVKKLKITEEQASEYIERLKKYQLVSTEILKLNDSEMTTYRFEPSPSILGFLTFSQEMINRPKRFFMNNGRPEKPYLD